MEWRVFIIIILWNTTARSHLFTWVNTKMNNKQYVLICYVCVCVRACVCVCDPGAQYR